MNAPTSIGSYQYDPNSIKPYLPTFKAACETIINNPDNNLVNLTLDNVCLETLYQNRDQLSLNRPVHIPEDKWTNALKNHVMAKLRKVKTKMDLVTSKQAAAAKEEAIQVAVAAKEEAIQAAVARQVEAAKEEHANDKEMLAILLDGVTCPKEKMKIYHEFRADKAKAKLEERNMQAKAKLEEHNMQAKAKREEHNMKMEMEEKKKDIQMEMEGKRTDNHIKKERIEVEKVVNVQKTEVVKGYIGSHGKPIREDHRYYDEEDHYHDYNNNNHNHDNHHYEQIENQNPVTYASSSTPGTLAQALASSSASPFPPGGSTHHASPLPPRTLFNMPPEPVLASGEDPFPRPKSTFTTHPPTPAPEPPAWSPPTFIFGAGAPPTLTPSDSLMDLG